jgi:hypothetical protein
LIFCIGLKQIRKRIPEAKVVDDFNKGATWELTSKMKNNRCQSSIDSFISKDIG